MEEVQQAIEPSYISIPNIIFRLAEVHWSDFLKNTRENRYVVFAFNKLTGEAFKFVWWTVIDRNNKTTDLKLEAVQEDKAFEYKIFIQQYDDTLIDLFHNTEGCRNTCMEDLQKNVGQLGTSELEKAGYFCVYTKIQDDGSYKLYTKHLGEEVCLMNSAVKATKVDDIEKKWKNLIEKIEKSRALVPRKTLMNYNLSVVISIPDLARYVNNKLSCVDKCKIYINNTLREDSSEAFMREYQNNADTFSINHSIDSDITDLRLEIFGTDQNGSNYVVFGLKKDPKTGQLYFVCENQKTSITVYAGNLPPEFTLKFDGSDGKLSLWNGNQKIDSNIKFDDDNYGLVELVREAQNQLCNKINQINQNQINQNQINQNQINQNQINQNQINQNQINQNQINTLQESIKNQIKTLKKSTENQISASASVEEKEQYLSKQIQDFLKIVNQLEKLINGLQNRISADKNCLISLLLSGSKKHNRIIKHLIKTLEGYEKRIIENFQLESNSDRVNNSRTQICISHNQINSNDNKQPFIQNRLNNLINFDHLQVQPLMENSVSMANFQQYKNQ